MQRPFQKAVHDQYTLCCEGQYVFQDKNEKQFEGVMLLFLSCTIESSTFFFLLLKSGLLLHVLL